MKKLLFMKVLLIGVYNYIKGGSESVFFNTAKMLEEQGHEVVYFTLKWEKNKSSDYSEYFPESKESRKGLLKNIKNLVTYFYHFEAAKKLEKLLEVEKPDIAHIHLLWGQVTGSIFSVLRKHKVPIILTAHDHRLVCPAYVFRNGRGYVCEICKGKYFYHCVLNKCCKDSYVLSAIMASEQLFRNTFLNPVKNIDGFIYVSDFSKQKHEEYMPGLKYKKSVRLYNFSNIVCDEIRSMPTEKYYLYFGRLSYEKGVKTLLSVFEKHRDCKLKIVGTGPEQATFKDFVLENNMKNVEFLGYKKGDDLFSLIKKAYFVVVPSECFENNPMTIIESYSFGTPVIGAKIGGIPEIIVENETGFLFDCEDEKDLSLKVEMTQNLQNDDYIRLSQGALSFAKENFHKMRYYENLLNFYQSVVSKEFK